MIENNWYVITGTLSSGKTTLIELLEQENYRVQYEVARILIDQEIAKGKAIQQIRYDELKFQREVLQLKLAIEKDLPQGDLIFFDRGIPDSIAYFKLYGAEEDPFLKEASKCCSYKKIFLLDPVIEVRDYARVESSSQRDQIDKLLLEAYRSLPFPIVTVPTLSPLDRVTFIIENL